MNRTIALLSLTKDLDARSVRMVVSMCGYGLFQPKRSLTTSYSTAVVRQLITQPNQPACPLLH